MAGALIVAHQDDEIFALNFLSRNPISHVFYLTDGVRKNASYSPAIRAQEAVKSWSRIDPSVQVFQIGIQKQLRDGILFEDCDRNLVEELQQMVSALSPSFILTTLHDGSHQDHDMAFFISKRVLPVGCPMYVFPTYRSNYFFPKFFRVMKMPSELEPESFRVKGGVKSFIKSIQIMIDYKSQLVTWIGLAPLILLRTLLGSKVLLCGESTLDFSPQKVFFEERGRAKVEEVRISIKNCLGF